LRHTSLRKPSSTNTAANSSYINNAYPAAPPPTPNINCICQTSTAPSTPSATASEIVTTSHPATTNTNAKENESKGPLLPRHNSHINQLQINYFEFPPKASLLLLDDSVTVTSLSAPSLATTTAVALAAASSAWPSSSNDTPTSAVGATGCISANNSPKTSPTKTPPTTKTTPAPTVIATSNMGRREIKRSNTSSSTTKSYDSGSDRKSTLTKYKTTSKMPDTSYTEREYKKKILNNNHMEVVNTL
ncbi:uncharacterized protein LOC133334756, partial [Musca vetustissima]|uniref:uncharacterized protein LOC133334756 n=1 Tax=Musca vetustissima TaxID=27455 RepID=UPI002AB6FAD9